MPTIYPRLTLFSFVLSLVFGSYQLAHSKERPSLSDDLKPSQKTQKPPVNPGIPALSFIELGGGIGVWYNSHQVLLKNASMPLHLFVEYGRDIRPWRIVAGINALTAFDYGGNDFRLEPSHVFLHGKYIFSKLIPSVPQNVELFGLAGVQGWEAKLIQQENQNIFDLSTIVESDSGLGMIAGLGARYYYRNFGLGAQFQQLIGQAKYFAGGDDKVDTRIGSSQLILSLSYRFRITDPIQCPTFK